MHDFPKALAGPHEQVVAVIIKVQWLWHDLGNFGRGGRQVISSIRQWCSKLLWRQGGGDHDHSGPSRSTCGEEDQFGLTVLSWARVRQQNCIKFMVVIVNMHDMELLIQTPSFFGCFIMQFVARIWAKFPCVWEFFFIIVTSGLLLCQDILLLLCVYFFGRYMS